MRTEIGTRLKGFASLLVFAANVFLRKHCFQRASALAYSSLLSLAPLAALSVAFFAGVIPLRQVAQEAQKFLVENLAPQSVAQVNDFIDHMLVNLTNPSAAFNIFGYTGLIVTAIALFITIEEVSNAVWEVQRRRPLLRSVLNFWTLITLGPIFIFLSIGVKLDLENIGAIREFSNVPAVRRLLGMILPFLFSVIGFFLMFHLVPDTRVRLRSSLYGAVMASVLWEVTKLGFALYVRSAVSFKNLYGSLGAIPIFLIWLYITWVIALYGMTYTFCHQNFRWRGWLETRRVKIDPELHYYLRLKVMGEVAQRFHRGDDAPTVDQISSALDAPSMAIEDTLEFLIDKGLVNLVKKFEGAYQPARPLDRIALTEIVPSLLAGNRDVLDFLKDHFPDRYSEIEGSINRASLGISLKDIVETPADGGSRSESRSEGPSASLSGSTAEGPADSGRS